MNGGEVLRIVDALHREKGIDKELIFESIEQALALAAKKYPFRIVCAIEVQR